MIGEEELRLDIETDLLIAYMQSRIDAGVAPETMLMLLLKGFATGVTTHSNDIPPDLLVTIAIGLEALSRKVRKAAKKNRSAKQEFTNARRRTH